MITQAAEEYSIQDLFGILKRNSALFAGTVCVSLLISIAAAFVLPKKYKSQATLNIQGGYFQNPLINDLISPVQNESELRAQRSSLLRLALTDEFLDSMGEKYGVYKSPSGDAKRLLERELFFRNIEYFAISNSAFQISVIAGDPGAARQMTKEVLDRMISTLVDERYKTLAKTRDAIQTHIKTLGLVLRDNAKFAPAQDREQLLAELQKVARELDVLLVKFTERHPQVVQLMSRRESLEKEIGALPEGEEAQDGGAAAGALLFGSIAKEPAQGLYNELLKKLSYLTIVLEMERDKTQVSYLGVIEQPTTPVRALFPNKRIFVLGGIGAGILLAIMLVAIIELNRGVSLSGEEVAGYLEVPFLGELPRLKADKGVKLLEAPALPALPVQ